MNIKPNKELVISQFGEKYQSYIDYISESNAHPVLRRFDDGFVIHPVIKLDIYNHVWYNQSYHRLNNKIIFNK